MLRELKTNEMELVTGGFVGLSIPGDWNADGTSDIMQINATDEFGNDIGGLDLGQSAMIANSLEVFNTMWVSSETDAMRAHCEQMLADALEETGTTAAVFGIAAAGLSAIPHPAAQAAARVLGVAAATLGGGTVIAGNSGACEGIH